MQQCRDKKSYNKKLIKSSNYVNFRKVEVLEAWYKLFKTGSSEAFAELMNALGA